ncbi:Transcription initiation factor TFIIB, Brf1 subunit/Transcription initiation factor TFIIB [Halapricum desulfuricans]|uniref:Transcription initiation factor TFIIB, Brf1 subunit/Transcription initiation factor TFIIB n=2 Tax=Halapricum desulfuricans TaxID=2841257 RepID=A0A897NGX7_9EURY|nr:Transcription initiation factor TFIIB, Brf1 subunit/Transcription initiation factor TFIIB [Halapricum desulfuricans]
MKQCPKCGAEVISNTSGTNSPFCTTCGFVVTEEVEENDRADTENTIQAEADLDRSKQVVARDSSDENLIRLLETVDEVGDRLLVEPSERRRSGKIAVQAWIEGLLSGRSIRHVAAASVLISCRLSHRNRPYKKVAVAAEIDSSSLHETCKVLVNNIEIELDPPRPVHYLPYIYKQLDLPLDAFDPYSWIEQLQEMPKGNPVGVAAAAAYLDLQDTDSSVSYREMGELVGLTKETLWRQSVELRSPES